MTDPVPRKLTERGRDLPVYRAANEEKIWCSLRGKLVGATDCATDACIAPEQRPTCWAGHLPERPVEVER